MSGAAGMYRGSDSRGCCDDYLHAGRVAGPAVTARVSRNISISQLYRTDQIKFKTIELRLRSLVFVNAEES